MSQPLRTLFLFVALVFPIIASHSGLAPIHPSQPDDNVFVTDVGSGLDTGCTFRSGGPLRITLKIDRFVGAISSSDTLQNVSTLVSKGVISSNARLRMPAFDVDSGAVISPPNSPEIDRVYFNGTELTKRLTGVNNEWIMNEFNVPIDLVKFPTRGATGSSPTPVDNEIRIEIDTGNIGVGELWCTAIDWVELSFEAMAPLMLVHGIAAQCDTWEPDAVNSFVPNLCHSSTESTSVAMIRSSEMQRYWLKQCAIRPEPLGPKKSTL